MRFDRWIDAVSGVMQLVYVTIMAKVELSRKAKLVIYQSGYIPTLTYCHRF